MILLRSLIAGVGAVVIGFVLLVLSVIAWAALQGSVRIDSGISSASIGISDIWVYPSAAVFFITGFVWQFQRARRGQPFMNALIVIALASFIIALVIWCAWYFLPTLEWRVGPWGNG